MSGVSICALDIYGGGGGCGNKLGGRICARERSARSVMTFELFGLF